MRTCGDCQLCCRVLPIAEISKAAGKRCGYQKFGVGCKVHGTPTQPQSCMAWSCWWLIDPKFEAPRPDRAGYVVDMMADFIVLGGDVFAGKRVPAIQVWADPKRPDAWRELLPWIKATAIGDAERAAVIRFNSRDAVVILPPALSSTGDWAETDTRMLKPIETEQLRRKTAEDQLRKIEERAREKEV